jgi:hypothetical protein
MAEGLKSQQKSLKKNKEILAALENLGGQDVKVL